MKDSTMIWLLIFLFVLTMFAMILSNADIGSLIIAEQSKINEEDDSWSLNMIG